MLTFPFANFSSRDDPAKETSLGLVWAAAVGAHFGNYFVSGMTKVVSGWPEPWTWLLYNRTETSIVIGLERGDNPLALFPAVNQAIWDAIQSGRVLVNLLVLGIQLGSVLAVTRRRTIILFCLVYDLFHIGVYLTLGAFFFFWIGVNIVVIVSARRMADETFTLPMKAIAVLMVIFGGFAFFTAHLGWLDGTKLASVHFYAETSEGKRVAVPASFFGIFAYPIAHNETYIPPGSFPQRTGGNTYNLADWRDSLSCGPGTISHQKRPVTLEAITRMVRDTDSAMRLHPDLKRYNLFYAYSHHVVPNPLLFSDFNHLLIDDIVRYHYVVDSVCISLEKGVLVRRVHRQEDFPIETPEAAAKP